MPMLRSQAWWISREDRELIQKGRMGNRLTVYEDRPAEFDAWNIDEGYLEKSWDVIDVEEFKVLENGPETAALHVRRRFQDSMIEQTIRFYRHTARIDFQTRSGLAGTSTAAQSILPCGYSGT